MKEGSWLCESLIGTMAYVKLETRCLVYPWDMVEWVVEAVPMVGPPADGERNRYSSGKQFNPLRLICLHYNTNELNT